MGLRGPIPPTFGNLRELMGGLYLQDNRLGRGLPDKLEGLAELEMLVLNDNEFTGRKPESWAWNMAKMERLEIQGNGMEFDVD